jgi:uncharacterized membrane protein
MFVQFLRDLWTKASQCRKKMRGINERQEGEREKKNRVIRMVKIFLSHASSANKKVTKHFNAQETRKTK